MRMPAQDFDALKRDLLAYAAGRIGFGTRGKRDWWDAFASVMNDREAKQHKSGWSHMYDTLGLNDAHIETALKRIFQS